MLTSAQRDRDTEQTAYRVSIHRPGAVSSVDLKCKTDALSHMGEIIKIISDSDPARIYQISRPSSGDHVWMVIDQHGEQVHITLTEQNVFSYHRTI